MAVAEHMALERRIDKLEAQLLAVEPVRIVTTFVVVRRGAEERCKTLDDVWRIAKRDPVVEIVERRPDLDVIIDAAAGVHLHRFEGEDPEYDELAEGLRVVEVEIACYAEQLEQIVSDAPITATEGGTRAGKTRVLVWWLFRQYLLRGHGVNEDHEVEAVFWWVREDSGKLYKHAVLWIERLWPADVFTGKRPGEKTKNPSHTLIGGSRLDYKHAHHSGSKAGTSLRSESVEAAVVDELSAIHHKENWRELKSRVAQTGGPIAAAYTPTAGHWSADLAKAALASGGAIVVAKLVMTQNPWWPYARIWKDLLKDQALTATVLVEQVLPAVDQAAAAREAVTDPHVLRMRWGIQAPVGLVLWREWDDRFICSTFDEAADELVLGSRRLPNVTGLVLGQFFRGSSMLVEGRARAGGKDFNVNPGVTIVYSLHGDPRAPTIYVHAEVIDTGPTLRNAQHVARLYPRLCMFCDPTGAMDYRHESHGAQSMSDAEEMRREGLECEPSNGHLGAKVKQLPQLDSINAMHRGMSQGLLRVHPRCVGVIKALTDMRAKPDGTIKKTSGVHSESDQVSAFGDALRYGVWPAWEPLLLAPANAA